MKSDELTADATKHGQRLARHCVMRFLSGTRLTASRKGSDQALALLVDRDAERRETPLIGDDGLPSQKVEGLECS